MYFHGFHRLPAIKMVTQVNREHVGMTEEDRKTCPLFVTERTTEQTVAATI